MDNFLKISRLLKSGRKAFMKDDFYEIAVKYEMVDGEAAVSLKYRNHQEVESSQSNESVMQVVMGGEFITEKEYEEY
jgi:hypothetical protein